MDLVGNEFNESLLRSPLMGMWTSNILIAEDALRFEGHMDVKMGSHDCANDG